MLQAASRHRGGFFKDKALEHDEPEFLEVPIQQLLPEKWHSDYVRACGGGERGEQLLGLQRSRSLKLGRFEDQERGLRFEWSVVFLH